MARTITVKGNGTASVRPDTVVITLKLTARNLIYDRAMEQASRQLTMLQEALMVLGFPKEELKTADFRVDTDYDEVKEKGIYRQVFSAYVIRQRLRLSFPMDTERLGQVLSAVSVAAADPELFVAFTVKDPTAVNREVLRSAAENARARAEVLCGASGVTLGQLLDISYSWGELNVYSDTKYELCEDSIRDACCVTGGFTADINPEDIHAGDTVTFVWEIA